MIARRGMLAGMVYGAGGLGKPRLDQELRRGPERVIGPGGAAGSQFARRFIAGVSPSPQVIIDSTLNLTIVFSGFGTDVASTTPIQAAIRFPTNSAVESGPAFVATTVITYTDGDKATATLICGSVTSGPTPGGRFSLEIAASHLGGHTSGTVLGSYTVSGSTITLNANAAILSTGGYLFYNSTATSIGGAGPSNQATPSGLLIPAVEFWHALTLNGPTWTSVAGHNAPAFIMDISGRVLLTGRVSGNPGTSATIATVPANYRPLFNSVTVPCSVSSSAGVNAGQTPRLTLDTSGNVTIAGLAAGAATLDLETMFAIAG